MVVPPDQVKAVDSFDVVVLGSAVCGALAQAARALVDRSGDALAARPVWLFSSGQGPRASGFRRQLVRKQLNFPDRAIAARLRIPEGEFRDWEEVKGWAAGIADAPRPGA